MYDKEMQEGGKMEMDGCCTEHTHHWPMKAKKDFKMAMLRKKEKMLEAKLAFIREMKDLVEKMTDEPIEKEESKK